MNKFDLNSYLSSKRKQVNMALGVIMDDNSEDSTIKDAMKHSLMSSGKRLRPILVLLSASLFGKPNKKTISASIIVEMLHTATLIHDDVVDESALRRGSPTVNKLWNNYFPD